MPENEPEWKKHKVGEVYENPIKKSGENERAKEIRRKETIYPEDSDKTTGGY